MEIYLNTYGTYLHKKGELFEIKFEDKKKKISPKRISSIIITNAATISTDAIQMCLEYNIDVVFLDKYGNPYGRIWLPKLGSTTYIRRRLLEIEMQDKGLEIIKSWVSEKIENQIVFSKKLIKKREKKNFEERLKKMEKLKAKLKSLQGKLSENADSIRGYEGNVSRHYFHLLADLIPKKYRFKGRSSRPAKDIFNAFLNYGYGILYSRVEKALIIAGLDPYIGLLHSDNYNKKSLVFDFIESFRILVEEPIFYLFSRRKVKKEHFHKIKIGFAVGENGKKLLVPEIMKHFDEIIRYKNRNISRINTIQAKAHEFANELIGKKKE